MFTDIGFQRRKCGPVSPGWEKIRHDPLKHAKSKEVKRAYYQRQRLQILQRRKEKYMNLKDRISNWNFQN